MRLCTEYNLQVTFGILFDHYKYQVTKSNILVIGRHYGETIGVVNVCLNVAIRGMQKSVHGDT